MRLPEIRVNSWNPLLSQFGRWPRSEDMGFPHSIAKLVEAQEEK